MKEYIEKIGKLLQDIKETTAILNLNKMKAEKIGLEDEMKDPKFWDDQTRAQQVSKQFDNLNDELILWKDIQFETDELFELVNLYKNESVSAKEQIEIEKKYSNLQKRYNDLEFRVMLSNKYDKNNAIVAVHAGTGGTDAQDWAEMLKRMLLRYCEKKNFKVKIVDESKGQEAGIKSLTFEVEGLYAYGYLKSESGVHRLVRISPFDAEAMRHTSFALVEVLPDLGDIEDIKIKDDEIRIDVFRSGGNGGQSVNTTDSAVRIVHLPTKISVVCQNERSQHQNKETAMKILKSKLFKVTEQAKQDEKQKIRGEYSSAEWGNQIRSYVLHPYKMVKDHRTKYEEKDPEAVLDGELENFVEAYLKDKKFNFS